MCACVRHNNTISGNLRHSLAHLTFYIYIFRRRSPKEPRVRLPRSTGQLAYKYDYYNYFKRMINKLTIEDETRVVMNSSTSRMTLKPIHSKPISKCYINIRQGA